VGRTTLLEERFYAITTPHRHHIELLDRLLAGESTLAPQRFMGS